MNLVKELLEEAQESNDRRTEKGVAIQKLIHAMRELQRQLADMQKALATLTEGKPK